RHFSTLPTPPNLHSPRRLHLAAACRLIGQPLFVASIHSPRRHTRRSGGSTGEEERNDSGERRRIRRKVLTSRKWWRRERRSVIGKRGKDASPILEAETRAGSRRTTRGWILGGKVVGKQSRSTFGR
ncbi:hypothetical protein PIB30_110072, partial [Stylosanthes scabra]|nr:hypothetical protein [Stylosanthes scabra]